MSIRRKVGRFRVLVAAMLLAVGTLAVPAATQPAQAQTTCTPAWDNGYPIWATAYDDRGVTLCEGRHSDVGFPPEVAVQIVDLTAGAEIWLHSDRVDEFESASNDNQYYKRSADQWFDWIQSTAVWPGDTSRLFSTSNASFMTDTSGDTTAMSLPERTVQAPFPITAHTYGAAIDNPDDSAWEATKRVLLKRGCTGCAVPPTIVIQGFPTHYTESYVDNMFFGPGTSWHGTVGFDPLYQVVDPVAPRTMVGTSGGGKVYILTGLDAMTLNEAQDILKSFGSQVEIQLDGGNSTQMYAEFDGLPYNAAVSGRLVPDVLAVYVAP